MWRDKATVVRELIYDKLQLQPGHRVLVIGECLGRARHRSVLGAQ
jgi:hypothetical protein